MSIKAALIIECDGQDCDCPAFASSSTYNTVARKQAADSGWLYRSVDDTDWGPAHILIKETL